LLSPAPTAVQKVYVVELFPAKIALELANAKFDLPATTAQSFALIEFLVF
jgi:hypothetical protein